MTRKHPQKTIQAAESTQNEEINILSPQMVEQVSQKVMLAVSKQFSGPLPPPEILQHYNEIIPGAAERILIMAEIEQLHAHAMQKQSLESELVMRKESIALQKEAEITHLRGLERGQRIASLLCICCLAGAGYATYLGSMVAVGCFLGLPILGFLKAFLPHATQSNSHKNK